MHWMHACTNACKCARIRVIRAHLQTHVHAYMQASTHPYNHICLPARVNACMHALINVYIMRACMHQRHWCMHMCRKICTQHAHIHACMRMYICKQNKTNQYIYIYIYTFIYTYVKTYVYILVYTKIKHSTNKQPNTNAKITKTTHVNIHIDLDM